VVISYCNPAILFYAGVAVAYLEFKNPGKRTSQSESEKLGSLSLIIGGENDTQIICWR
jgi:hypothetical protein